MKKLLTIVIALLSWSITAQAQLADITYSIKTGGIYSYGNATGGACWETGDEEYSAYLDSWDNVNGTSTGTGCQQCSNNGNCGWYGANVALQTRSNNAYTISFRIDAWEDDQGNRCSYDGPCFLCNSDDCRRNETNTTNIREGAYPSNGTYTNTSTWGSTGDHQYYFQYTWKYSGTNSLITPTCTVQSAAYTTGAIRSWTVYLTAGVTYKFENCSGASNDTYLRLFGSDGYTVVTSNDDGCSTQSTITYTAASSGYVYLEMSEFTRGALSAGGTLYYSIVPKTGAMFSSPIAVGTLSCGTTYSNTQSNVVNTGFCNDYVGQSSDDIYYQFVLSSTATINMSHCGSGFDTYMSLLNSGGTTVATNDDNGTLCTGTSSSLQQNLTAGTYYIVSEGYGSNSGNINTQISIQNPSGGSITGTTPVCPNQTGVSYSISGVSFATDYQWSVPSGASITAGQGTTSITVNWGSTSGNVMCTPRTYGGACSGSVVSYPVTFNTLSVAPTSITGTNVICYGSSTTLTLSGGTAGTGATAQWFSGSCGGVSVGTGNSITVSPTSTTDYFVRYSGTCNTTGCATVKVYVSGESAPIAGDVLATTTSSRTCTVNDALWHYFRNSSGQIIAAINSNGQNLGSVTMTVTIETVTHDGTYLSPKHGNGGLGRNGSCFGMPELSMRRWYAITITGTNPPASPSSVRLFFTSADYTNYSSELVSWDGLYTNDYPACYGYTVGAADLVVSKDETIDLSPTAASVSGGPNSSSQYDITVPGFSTFRFHTKNFVGSPLPVELVSFTGYNHKDRNILNWTTASEKNADKFEVEKSTNNTSGWTYIGWQKAVGGNVQKTYTFSDKQPTVGNNYYRLKMIDNDGTFTYSQTININVSEAMVNGFGGIFPNPATTVLNVHIQSTGNYTTVLKIQNILGQVIFNKDVSIQKGVVEIPISIASFAIGTYIVSFVDESGTLHTQKIVKQ